MKSTKKVLAILCTAAMLSSAMTMPASATAILTEGYSFAEILQQMEQDTDSYFCEVSPGTFFYLTEDAFHPYQMSRQEYTIYLEEGASLPEDALTKLQDTLQYKTGGTSASDPIALKAEERQISYGKLLGNYLEQMEDGSYRLTLEPTINGEDIVSYLRTLPEFVRVTYSAYGVDMNHYQQAIGSDPENLTTLSLNYQYIVDGKLDLYLYTVDDTALTEADLPEGIPEVVSLEKFENDYYGESYTNLVLRLSDPAGFTHQDMLQLLKSFEAMEQVEHVEFGSQRDEQTIGDATSDYIGEGAIPYLTRGDCDNDETIGTMDAYQTLLHTASVAVGKDATLSDRAQVAADINGDGEVNTMDAYYILLHRAMEGAGMDGALSTVLGNHE